MRLEKYIPDAILQPFIKHYLVIAYDEEAVNRILPDTNLTLAFRYKGKVSTLEENGSRLLPMALISGLRKSPRLINYAPGSGNVLVVFKETGATAFFGEPLHELFEESAALDELIPPSILAVIEEALAAATSNKARVAAIEQFLLAKLYRRTPDQLVAHALEKIYAQNGDIKIKELANALFISQDAFEKRFRKAVGTPPKQFCFIVRMKAIAAQRNQNRSFTQIAINAGYFDQPHFNKDFKLFTGQTPKEFFQSPPLW